MQSLNRQYDNLYPHIERLRQDFGLQLSQRPDDNRFSLVVTIDQSCKQLTPGFKAVSELEEYAAAHMTDILHDYLCCAGSEPL